MADSAMLSEHGRVARATPPAPIQNSLAFAPVLPTSASVPHAKGVPFVSPGSSLRDPGYQIFEYCTLKGCHIAHPAPLTSQTRYELEMTFSRGLSTGWLRGIDNQSLVHARFGTKRGVFLGEVIRVDPQAETVTLRPAAAGASAPATVNCKLQTVNSGGFAPPLKPGDGVVFDAGAPDLPEEGGRIYQVDTHPAATPALVAQTAKSADGGSAAASGSAEIPLGGRREAPPKPPSGNSALPDNAALTLHFGRGDINFTRVHPGNLLWKTNDPALDRELRATYEGDKIRHTRPIDIEARGHAGAPLALTLDDRRGHTVCVESAIPLAPAQTQPLTASRLREQLGRLGGTPYHLGELTTRLDAPLMLPMSELNRLRREAVEKLTTLRAAPRRWTIRESGTGCQPVGKVEAGVPTASPSDTGCQPVISTSSPKPTGWQPVPHQADTGWQPVPHQADTGWQPVPRQADTGRMPVPLPPEIIPLVRTLSQLDAALATPGLSTFYCEFENPKHYRDATARFRRWQSESIENRESKIENLPSIWLAPPRIFKPGEDWILDQIRSAAPDGYLVRNHEHLRYFAADRKRGDYSLNVANHLTAAHFLSRYNLERVTASYDLNIVQLEALLLASGGVGRTVPVSRDDAAAQPEASPYLHGLEARATPESYDITIHQHMPMFHMDHCVACAFLTTASDYRACGRPCDKHRLHLRDRTGALLPLKADAACRNTVFNNRAQTGAEYLPRLLALGARHFRVEFVDEPPAEVARTLAQYQRLLRNEIDGATLWRELKLLNQLGVTRGQMAG